MAGKIFGSVLEFAVESFVQFLDDFCAGGFDLKVDAANKKRAARLGAALFNWVRVFSERCPRKLEERAGVN